MKKVILALLAGLILMSDVSIAQSQKAVTDLPNISVIGNMVGSRTGKASTFELKEIEFSFQHYLYPTVKADVFAALHKEASGERKFELEEAYVTFSDVWGVFMPESTKKVPLGLIVGQKLLSVGKINPLHPEQWRFVDKPMVVSQFLGGDEGLKAEGAQFDYLLGLPFFSQVSLGYWTAAAHAEEEGGDSHGVEFEDRLLNGRWWSGFALSDNQELEIGLNYLLGNAKASESDDQAEVIGVDVKWANASVFGRSLAINGEYYRANYGEEGEAREEQTGAFVSSVYDYAPKRDIGLRYGVLGTHGDEGSEKTQWSVMWTRQLTETSKFRLQYNTGDGVDDTVYAQFIFGMGPHAHVLQ